MKCLIDVEAAKVAFYGKVKRDMEREYELYRKHKIRFCFENMNYGTKLGLGIGMLIMLAFAVIVFLFFCAKGDMGHAASEALHYYFRLMLIWLVMLIPTTFGPILIKSGELAAHVVRMRMHEEEEPFYHSQAKNTPTSTGGGMN